MTFSRTLITGTVMTLLLPFSALAAMEQEPPAGLVARPPFSDVQAGSVFFDAVSYLKNQGFVSGYADGTFKPGKLINRAEFLKIAMGTNFTQKALDTCSPRDIYHFKDASYNDWYSPYLCVAVQYRIIEGYSDGSFHPDANISFTEAAKIVAIMDNNYTNGMNYPDRPLPDDKDDNAWYEPYVRYLGEHAAIPTMVGTLNETITRGEMSEMLYRLLTDNMDKPTKTYEEMSKKDSVIKSY